LGNNYWMFVETKENATITRQLGYKIFGMGPKYRKRANRMQKNDRVIFYTSLTKKWTASATISKTCFEDATVVWKPESRPNDFKFRVEKMKGSRILKLHLTLLKRSVILAESEQINTETT